jgi:hypothetical protein
MISEIAVTLNLRYGINPISFIRVQVEYAHKQDVSPAIFIGEISNE